MTFARLVLAASTNDPVPEPATTATLPAERTARSLVQFYEANVLALYPVLPRTSLYALVSDMYQENPRPFRSSEYWLFWMVLAVASAAQSRTKQDAHYRNAVEFVASALPHADGALMPGYVSQLQSLLLLTQYSMLDPAHFDSWQLIGFTCRAVVDLGLHQDPPFPQQSDKDALDARRRTFYCVYALDRLDTPNWPLHPASSNVVPCLFFVQGHKHGARPCFLLLRRRRLRGPPIDRSREQSPGS